MCGITPTSKRGQIVYMFIMLLIPLIPIFALITQNMLLLNNIIVRKADLISSDQSVLKSDETAKLIRSVATLSLVFLQYPCCVGNIFINILSAPCRWSAAPLSCRSSPPTPPASR